MVVVIARASFESSARLLQRSLPSGGRIPEDDDQGQDDPDASTAAEPVHVGPTPAGRGVGSRLVIDQLATPARRHASGSPLTGRSEDAHRGVARAGGTDRA